MDEILSLADDLAGKIAESPRYAELMRAEGMLDEDAGAKEILQGFVELNDRLGRAEAEGTPVEPEDKRKLQGLREKVSETEKIQDLVRAQADFAELMNKVNERIGKALRDASDAG